MIAERDVFRLLQTVLLVCLYSVISLSFASGSDVNVKSEWVDPQGRTPTTYEEYYKRHPHSDQPFRTDVVYTSPNEITNGTFVMVVVNESLYPDVQSSLNRYADDVESEGFTVEIHTVSGGEPDDLRNYLYGRLNDGLSGALFVGDLPIAWYEIIMTGEEYPFDYYYMDLNGEWIDSDGDGTFDNYPDETEPEIWMGRLTASPLTCTGESEADLVNRYFSKNHAYRQGEFDVERRALVYVDDDFVYLSQVHADEVRQIYDDVVVVDSLSVTVAGDYMQRITDGYEWVQLYSHSGAQGHSFKSGHGTDGGSVIFDDIIEQKPKSVFYHLRTCSSCRFIEEEYIGGWYIFSDSRSLVAIGSVKSISPPPDFYFYLSRYIGDAYKEWFKAKWLLNPWTFYAGTILGDPTLKVSQGMALCSKELDEDSEGRSDGDGNGYFLAGETVELFADLMNCDTQGKNAVMATLRSGHDHVFILDSTETYGYITPDQCSEGNDGFLFQILPTCPAEQNIVRLEIVISDVSSNTWIKPLSFWIETLEIQLYFVSFTIDDSQGNNDGVPNPGETVDLFVEVRNHGNTGADDVTATLHTDDPFISIDVSSPSFPDILAYESMTNESPFTLTVSSDCPEAHYTAFQLLLQNEEEFSMELYFSMNIGDGTCFEDDMENGCGAWIHRGYNHDIDQWHLSTARNHTPSGNCSWKCGSTISETYSAGINAGLVTPPIHIEYNTLLTFWHWIDAEAILVTQHSYDGGAVYVVDETGDWELIEPEGGYPYRGVCLSYFDKCFSGAHDWTKETFDLSRYAGRTIQILFQFVSDEIENREGWYIDDIEVSSVQLSRIVLDDFEAGTDRWDLGQGWSPGPYGHNSSTSITDSPDGNYPNNAHNPLTYGESFHLAGIHSAALSYWQCHALEENHDYGYIEVSLDSESWARVDSCTGFIYFSPVRNITLLNDYCGEQIWIRFCLESDDQGTEDGWYLDDIELWKNIDRGDVNCEGNVNVLDVLGVIQIILNPEAVQTEYERWASDCNGDGVINILDVIGIVNVILGTGTCIQ